MSVVAIESGRNLPPIAESTFTPIEYSPDAAKELARLFMKNRLWTKGIKPGEIDVSDARLLGRAEVQGQFLSMLGQDNLLNGASNQDPLIIELKPITKQHIDSLGGSYRAARRFFVDRDLELREWTNKPKGQVTPEESRVQGRMYELAIILTELGQRDLVTSIDAEIGRSPGQIK